MRPVLLDNARIGVILTHDATTASDIKPKPLRYENKIHRRYDPMNIFLDELRRAANLSRGQHPD